MISKTSVWARAQTIQLSVAKEIEPAEAEVEEVLQEYLRSGKTLD